MSMNKRIPVAYAATVASASCIFIIDRMNPLGTAEWLGYILPLLISSWTLRPRCTFVLSAICSVLIILPFYLTPPNIEPHGALFNRCLGVGVIWVIAALLNKQQRSEGKIKRLNADLELRATELAAACRELESLNRSLEERVRVELAGNREKDYMLILQSRQAAMGEMINNIAHQWRQPLIALGLFVHDLTACRDSAGFTREYLDGFISKSSTAIGQMSETIEDFLNFLKPNRVKAPFSPKHAIDNMLAFIEWGARRPAVTYGFGDEEDMLITGYANEYSQVLLNIFINSRDALAERRIANPKVDIRMFKQGERSVVMVTDNAGGIAEDIIEKIFEPYFTTKEKGSGIGLYMSRMIIERNMDGRLTVRNTGEGAEFRIEV